MKLDCKDCGNSLDYSGSKANKAYALCPICTVRTGRRITKSLNDDTSPETQSEVIVSAVSSERNDNVGHCKGQDVKTGKTVFFCSDIISSKKIADTIAGINYHSGSKDDYPVVTVVSWQVETEQKLIELNRA